MKNSNKQNINFYYQDRNSKILNKINKVFSKDKWVNGSIIDDLEIKLKKYLRTNKSVCTCNSGTDALQLALLLDKHKDKNIYLTTPFSYIASSSMAKHLGLELIYIDIHKDNFLLDLDKLESFLKKCPIKVRNKIRGNIYISATSF